MDRIFSMQDCKKPCPKIAPSPSISKYNFIFYKIFTPAPFTLNTEVNLTYYSPIIQPLHQINKRIQTLFIYKAHPFKMSIT